MVTERNKTGRFYLVGAIALVLVVGAVIPASAGVVFGNRSRDKQTEVEKSSSPKQQVSTTATNRSRTTTFQPRSGSAGIVPTERARGPVFEPKSRATEVISAERTRASGNLYESLSSQNGAANLVPNNTNFNGIWDRSRNGNVTKSAAPSTDRERTSETTVNRDNARTGVFNRAGNTARNNSQNVVRENNQTRSSLPSMFKSRDTSNASNSNADRSRFFERVNERSRVQSRYEPSYYKTYNNYYTNYYYRPYTGWRAPYFYSGAYYYSWPQIIEPCYYGHYIFSYVRDYSYPSLYFYYGYLPYIHSSRAFIISLPIVRYIEVPVRVNYRYDDDYYLAAPAYGSIDRALSDVRLAWLKHDWSLIRDYVDVNQRIHVYTDGRYSYSVEGRDYLDMTRDALDRIDTVDLDFYSVKRQGDNRYVAYGTHTYYDVNGEKKYVYVSYTFEKVYGNWNIVEVGSSRTRL